MNENDYPKLILPEWFTERFKDEMPSKGFMGNVEIVLENGDHYLINFIDPIRLKQDLESEVRIGRPYFAEQGMVVLPEVTIERINDSLKFLLKDGFFDGLKPLMKKGS